MRLNILSAAPSVGASVLLAAPAMGQVVDSHTTLYLSFNNSLTGAAGELPAAVTGTSFTSGVSPGSGQGLSILPGDRLQYAAAGNLSAPEGTVEFFLRPNWNGGDSNSYTFLSWGIGGGLLLSKDGASNLRLIFNRFSIPDPEQGVAFGVGDWVAGDWHELAYTWSTTNAVASLYIDGELATSNPSTAPLNTPSASLFDIGTDNGGNDLDGTLDELRISDVARTPAEVLTYYATFVPEPASGAVLAAPLLALALRRRVIERQR